MKVLWWLAFASMISNAFKFFCLSSRKVWFVCFGCRLMDVCSSSSNSLSISLVPSMDLFKIPLRFRPQPQIIFCTMNYQLPCF